MGSRRIKNRISFDGSIVRLLTIVVHDSFSNTVTCFFMLLLIEWIVIVSDEMLQMSKGTTRQPEDRVNDVARVLLFLLMKDEEKDEEEATCGLGKGR